MDWDFAAMVARRALVVIVLLLLMAGTLAGVIVSRSWGHDIYRHWHPPGNAHTSCCNDADCRPTRAFLDQDGNWRAWNGTTWLRVPWERVLPTDYAGDGRNHLCEKEGFIYCFSPTTPKG